jgi:hypothetical protein
VIVTVPVYVPGASSRGSAVTVKSPGVLPDCGVTDNHELPTVTDAVYDMPGTEVELFSVAVAIVFKVALTDLPPLACESESESVPVVSGVLKNGGCARTSRTRFFTASVI